MTATLTSWKYFVVEPEAAINLCVNPSAESAIAGIYAGTNCTVTQSSEQARYGKYSVKGVPTGANTTAYIYTTITPTAVSHTYSVSVYGVAGVNYTVQIQLAADGTVRGTTSFVGNGHWQRVSITATMTAAPHNLIVERVANQNTTAAFYADGWLFKTGADNLYFDGDTVDPYQDTPQFYWSGTPHASTSVRLASTRYGGTLLDISAYCTVKSVQGLTGLTSFETNVSGLALGGSIYQNSHANARRFSLICRANTPMTSAFGTLQRKLARLEKAVNPKRMKVDQPLRLLIYGVDSAGTQASDPVLLDCVYESGLEGALENRAPSFPLTFHMDNPVIKADGYNVTSLSPSTTVNAGNDGCILFINGDTGSTSSISGFSTTGAIYGITEDSIGGEFIYGIFLNYGDANGDGIIYVNSSGVASSLGTGAVGSIYSAEYGPDGKLYATGTGDNIGGVAAADKIGRWTGSAWEAVGASGLNGTGWTLASDGLGNIYVGGAFTTAGGVTVNRIAKYTPSTNTWAALGSGTVGVSGTVVYSIACLPNNKVVFGGDFTDAGGVAAYDYLATFDGTNYGALGAAPNGVVNKLIYDQKSGRLYAFGAFTQIGGITAYYAAYWDGNNWNPMPGCAGGITQANIHENGNIYAYSSWSINGTAYAYTIAYWNGSEWRLPEFENSKSCYNVLYRKLTKQVVISGYASSGSTTYTVPAVSTITNNTEGNIYPSITLDATGYYVYSLYNRSTGERIFLNGLQVYTGEKIELIFSPNGYTITSNIRGDMRSAVLSGSSPTFSLQPGANYVSCFVHPSPTAAVTIPLKYPAAAYISLNETVYE